MSETLPRSASAPNKIDVATPTTEELHIIVNGEAPAPGISDHPTDTPESALDTRETSRSAGLLRRVASFLEQRAINKAHTAALKEYRSVDNLDYTDHVAKLADSDNETYQATGQKLLDREHRREDRAEFIDNASTFARTTGAAALNAARTTGEVAVGLSYLAGERIAKSAKSTGEALKGKALEATDKVKDATETGILYGMEAVDTVKSAAETGVLYGMNAIDEAKDHIVATKDVLHMRLKEFAEAARNRRTARRAKWAARKQDALEFIQVVKTNGENLASAAIEKGQEVIDTARNEGQRVIGETTNRINTARAAGSAALEAYAATTQAHNEQNKL